MLTLRELRGRPVVLVFYPADWSPVCGEEMVLFNNGERHDGPPDAESLLAAIARASR